MPAILDEMRADRISNLLIEKYHMTLGLNFSSITISDSGQVVGIRGIPDLKTAQNIISALSHQDWLSKAEFIIEPETASLSIVRPKPAGEMVLPPVSCERVSISSNGVKKPLSMADGQSQWKAPELSHASLKASVS